MASTDALIAAFNPRHIYDLMRASSHEIDEMNSKSNVNVAQFRGEEESKSQVDSLYSSPSLVKDEKILKLYTLLGTLSRKKTMLLLQGQSW